MDAGNQIMSYLTQGNFFLCAGAIYLFPTLLRRIKPVGKAMENQWVVRLMPLWPILAGLGAVWVPGAIKLPDDLIGTKLIAGVWVGALAMIGHKLLGQTILGDDPRIKSMAVVSRGQKVAVEQEK